MELVFDLYGDPDDDAGPAHLTKIWVSEQVLKELESSRFPTRFKSKLLECAESGFGNFLHGKNFPFRKEEGGTYGFGIPAERWRLYGFYENPTTYSDFVAIRIGKKRGQQRGSQCDRMVEEVEEIRVSKGWKKFYDK